MILTELLAQELVSFPLCPTEISQTDLRMISSLCGVKAAIRPLGHDTLFIMFVILLLKIHSSWRNMCFPHSSYTHTHVYIHTHTYRYTYMYVCMYITK